MGWLDRWRRVQLPDGIFARLMSQGGPSSATLAVAGPRFPSSASQASCALTALGRFSTPREERVGKARRGSGLSAISRVAAIEKCILEMCIREV